MYNGDDDQYREWFSGARSRAYWVRGALMVLFYVVLWFVRFIVLLLALFQFGAAIIVGRPNQRVKPFARQLAAYMQQLVEFVTWASELRPYPLSPWPAEAGEGERPEDTEPQASWETEEELAEPFEPEPEPEETFEPEPGPEEPFEPEHEPEEAERESAPAATPPEEETEPPKPAKARSAKARSRSPRKKDTGKSEASDRENGSEDDDTPPRPDA